MAFQFLLFAAQAAGVGLDMYQRRKQEQFANMGADIESKELGLQMEREALASSEEALANTERLREVMATQRAIYGARGQQAAQGTSAAIGQRNIRVFNADERARQLSMGYRKHQLESQQRLLGINKAARREERQTKDFMGALNLLNFNGLEDMLSTGGNQKLGNTRVPSGKKSSSSNLYF